MSERKTALVTGSTSGIGLGIARALAADGFDVMLNGFEQAAVVRALVDELVAGHCVQVEYHGADLSQPSQARALVQETIRRFGAVDVLVNNAGIQHVSPLERFPDDAWHRIIAINLSAAFFTSREALPVMRDRRWGRIVNTASVHGLVASVDKAAYVSAKHGIIGLTKVIALEAAGSGITCNAICPGFVLTPLVEEQIKARADADGIALDAAADALLREKQPSRQFVSVEQVGGLVSFLCSDSAAQITGASMPIDGGWTAQ